MNKFSHPKLLAALAMTSIAGQASPAAAAYCNPYSNPEDCQPKPVVAAAYCSPYDADCPPVRPQSAIDVQTEIVSSSGMRISLPSDGSSCDPRTILSNLQKLKAAGVLEVSNLTKTTAPAVGACYGIPCPGDMQRKLAEHCAKSATLEAVTRLVESRK